MKQPVNARKWRNHAREIYRSESLNIPEAILQKLSEYKEEGYGHVPVCMAKTQYSFTNDPSHSGAPTGFMNDVKYIALDTGAEFLVALAGDMMRMPGLHKVQARLLNPYRG